MLDRITYRVRILEVNEEGYRLRQSRQDAVLTSPRSADENPFVEERLGW